MDTNSEFRNTEEKVKSCQLNPLDVAVHILTENEILNEEFYTEWNKRCPSLNVNESFIENINMMRNSLSDNVLLLSLIEICRSLNLHVGLGGTRLSCEFEKLLQKLQGNTQVQVLGDHYILGREEERKAIEDVFDMKRWSSTYSGVCVCGMGGNGKTTLAESICCKLQEVGCQIETVVARDMKSLVEFLGCILVKLGKDACPNEKVSELQDRILSVLSSDLFKKETVLLFDNIDDIHEDWDQLLQFIESLLVYLKNNPDNGVKLLLTSRRKLASDQGYLGYIRDFLEWKTEIKQERFNGLCLEIELQPLGERHAQLLVKELIPKKMHAEINIQQVRRMVQYCGYNPLLIHTICDTLKHGDVSLSDIISNIWSCSTPVALRYNPNLCIEQTFGNMTSEFQEMLVRLHVFQTSNFSMDDAMKITEDLHPITLQLKILYLRMHHMIEIRTVKLNYITETDLSIHPIVSYFLMGKEKTKEYKQAIQLFMKLSELKMNKYENKVETNFREAQYILFKNQTQFEQYFRFLSQYPTSASKDIKINKQISSVADMILNNEEKVEFIDNLSDKCIGLLKCFWELEKVEVFLDEDRLWDTKRLLNKVKQEISISSGESIQDIMSILLFYMYLKGRMYFRKDKFSKAYNSLYAALHIFNHSDFIKTRIPEINLNKRHISLRSNIYNTLACTLLRNNRGNEALHCFRQAFILMTRKGRRYRSQKQALYISNMGSCYYNEGLEILKNNPGRRPLAYPTLHKALKHFEMSIKMRGIMRHKKFRAYAADLKKRGKVNLELGKFPESSRDFIKALKIYWDIETLPHFNITICLYLVAKSFLSHGQDLQRNGIEEWNSNLLISKELYGYVADFIHKGGIEDFDIEYENIKSDHLWLLKNVLHQSKELSRFENIYQECECRRNASKPYPVRGDAERYKRIDEVIDLNKLSNLLDDSTKELLTNDKWLEIGDEENSEDIETFCQNIISYAHSQEHKNSIKYTLLELQKECENSDEMTFFLDKLYRQGCL